MGADVDVIDNSTTGTTKPAEWYAETARQIYRPKIYRKGASMLISEGRMTASDFPAEDYDGYRAPSTDFIDGKKYDAKDPIAYINSFEIGNKD